MKKAMSILLMLSLTVTVIAAARTLTVLAAPGDAGALSAGVKIYVGRYENKVFTPLAADEKIKQGQTIAVRIAPQTNYLVGASRYVVMFDRTLFTLEDSTPKNTFTVNADNNYYNDACTGFDGENKIQDYEWPVGLLPIKEQYQAVAVWTQTGINSLNGGYPEVLPGNWLFQFRLTAKQPITTAGVNPHIWVDESWFKSNTNPSGYAYIPKCLDGQLSSSADNNYDFDYNFSGAIIKLPLTANQVIPTTAPTTKPPVTTTTTTSQTGSTTANSGTTTRPGNTTTRPGNTTTRPGSTTTRPGDTTAATVPGATTIRDPLKPIPTIAVTVFVTDAAGSRVFVTGGAGSTVYLTTIEYQTVDETTDTETQTDANDNAIENPEDQNSGSIKKILIIVVILAAIGGAAALLMGYMKKKNIK